MSIVLVLLLEEVGNLKKSLMKIKLSLFIVMALAFGFTSCAYDNYDAPESMLQGKVVYNGEPIGVATNEVNIELWEPGWQLRNRIDVAVAQDGSYSAALFPATYKLMFRRNQGPFRMKTNPATNSDTILVNLSGNQVLDIEVMPYYMIRNPQITASGRTIRATANIEKIITDANARNVERVSLYVNKTQFVDHRGNYNLARTDVAGSNIPNLSNVSLSVEAPSLTTSQNYVFARIGVKIQGVEHMIFSPVQRIQL
ncbi:DUF3823 domain-containing protein [soil metagenome]